MRYAPVVFLVIALCALRAYAGPPFSCCYCTSPASGDHALLCEAFATGDAVVDFQAMCEAKGGDTALCVAAISLDSCPTVFSDRGIICPTSSAPALGSTAMAALAAMLLALGVVVLGARMRARPGHARD